MRCRSKASLRSNALRGNRRSDKGGCREDAGLLLVRRDHRERQAAIFGQEVLAISRTIYPIASMTKVLTGIMFLPAAPTGDALTWNGLPGTWHERAAANMKRIKFNFEPGARRSYSNEAGSSPLAEEECIRIVAAAPDLTVRTSLKVSTFLNSGTNASRRSQPPCKRCCR